ncbi:retrotransposon protein, putative, Ty1-copia subclass [Panicum miliaceum]|uniref:Retrotransposon protein, putative, Ty1-copia subclass n=1 Tax=Panicum miliaceum TaxID=4540 RepID=A0A3L6PJD6_PANMI|nr:retrotransposon protein, putative, Ty1-copia subclass [Panicum miliaceum]
MSIARWSSSATLQLRGLRRRVPRWRASMVPHHGEHPRRAAGAGLAPHILEADLHLAHNSGEPRSFAEVNGHAAWCAMMQLEMDPAERNQTWELVDLSAGHCAITLKQKKDEAGTIVKHKARLFARGFAQQEGVDFNDAFTPVSWMESVRILLALAAQEGWRVHYMDFKTAFLNGDLKEEVYVHQPPGFVIPTRRARSFVCAKPSTACGRHRGRGTPSLTPLSGPWGSCKARMKRPSTGGQGWQCPTGGRLHR